MLRCTWGLASHPEMAYLLSSIIAVFDSHGGLPFHVIDFRVGGHLLLIVLNCTNCTYSTAEGRAVAYLVHYIIVQQHKLNILVLGVKCEHSCTVPMMYCCAHLKARKQ